MNLDFDTQQRLIGLEVLSASEWNSSSDILHLVERKPDPECAYMQGTFFPAEVQEFLEVKA